MKHQGCYEITTSCRDDASISTQTKNKGKEFTRISSDADLLLCDSELVDELMISGERLDKLGGVRRFRRELIIDEEDGELDFPQFVHLSQELDPEDVGRSSSVDYESTTVNKHHHDLVVGSFRSGRSEPTTLYSVHERGFHPVLVAGVDG